MTKYKTFLTESQVNDKTLTILIEIEVEEELQEVNLIDHDLSLKEKKDFLKRLDSGEVFSAFIVVRAKALEVEGNDSLGSCYIETKNFSHEIDTIVSDHSMIENAIEDLLKKMKRLTEKLKEYF